MLQSPYTLGEFWVGAFHVTGLYGPGIWVSNPYGLTGRVQSVNPAWGLKIFYPQGIFEIVMPKAEVLTVMRK
jgi:hypothetical protein